MKVKLNRVLSAHLLHVAGKKQPARKLVNDLLLESVTANLLKVCTAESVKAYLEHLTKEKEAKQELLVKLAATTPAKKNKKKTEQVPASPPSR
jgi:hypothetical protein